MRDIEIHSCPELMDLIQEVGFLPLLDSGIRGFSAEELVDEDNRYVVFDDGGWGWSLLTTPESLLGQTSPPDPGLTPNPSPNGEGNFEGRGRTPQESFERMFEHLRRLLPEATEKQIEKLIK